MCDILVCYSSNLAALNIQTARKYILVRHTHTQTLAQTHKHSHTHTNTLTKIHSHTQTHTLAYTVTHTQYSKASTPFRTYETALTANNASPFRSKAMFEIRKLECITFRNIHKMTEALLCSRKPIRTNPYRLIQSLIYTMSTHTSNQIHTHTLTSSYKTHGTRALTYTHAHTHTFAHAHIRCLRYGFAFENLQCSNNQKCHRTRNSYTHRTRATS